MDPMNNVPDIDLRPLYSSRLIKNYVEYVKQFQPEIDIDSLLSYAGITSYELEDQGHWFNQRQVDRFHEILTQRTGDPNISRKAGRFSTSSKAIGILRQHILGFLGPASAYSMLPKLNSSMTRASTMKIRRLSRNKMEVTVLPTKGAREKPYQCQTRMGILESMAKLFTNKFAEIEHPSCPHKGNKEELYIITWERSPSIFWKRLLSLSVLFSSMVSVFLFFVLPLLTWFFVVALFVLFTIMFSFHFERLEKSELIRTIETQGDAAKDLLDEMNIRYNNALLVQEIGQATSTILDIDKLINTVVGVMEKHLDFDRGLIMLANKKKTRLVYTAGYGYEKKHEEFLGSTGFRLDNPESKGVFVLAFKEQRPSLVNDISEIEKSFSVKSLEFARRMNVQSFICVPIVYEKESLGILAVDNITSKRPLTQSEVNLLLGVASQTAVSITNAMSFQKLQDSEKKYRDLVENANSIILRRDIDGNITFFNEFAQKFFGYDEGEIIGKNVAGTILPKTESTKLGLERLTESLNQNPERPVVSQDVNLIRNGSPVSIAWTYKPIFDSEGRFTEILCIGNDITELKRAEQDKKDLEAQLQHAQRMEAIGTLAGGIAHDFNNILGAIIGYTEMSLYDASESSQDLHNMEEVLKAGYRAKDLVQQILAFSRQTEQERKPVNLSPIVKEALKLLRASIPTTIEISQHIDMDTGAVNSDPTQIHQVMMNLCTNAVHAMRDNGGVLKVTLNKVDMDREITPADINPGPYVRLTVSDTGHGIDRNTIERMFDPYFTTKEKGVGTGLGLAVVHGIVKSHGGTITVQSEPGKGATFNVFLPRIDSEVMPELKDIETVCMGNERILFVDDEEPLVNLGKQMLERLGYKVECRTSSIEALEAFRARPYEFDLIITDMTMPNMTGEMLAREIIKIRPDIPIIICTGFSERITDEKIKEMGIREFVLKPFDMNALAKTIRKILE